MIKYLAALISIFLGAFAQYFFKLGVKKIKLTFDVNFWHIFQNYQIWTGLFLYGLSVIIWFYVLSQLELSKAYPLVSIGYVLTLIIGYFWLDEALTLYKIIGIGFIIIGVIFISNS